MSAILKLLDAEIAKYESLVKQLKASRQAIASAESGGSAPAKTRNAGPAKRRGRPKKNGAAEGAAKAESAPTGRKRGRPPKKAADAPAAAE